MFGGILPGFRFGIAARLALGFAVVGLLAATANLVAERGAALVAAAWQPAQIASIQATLSASPPIGRRREGANASRAELPSPDKLLAAVADLQRATLAGIATSSASDGGDASSIDLNRARLQLEVAQKAFDREASGIIRDECGRKSVSAQRRSRGREREPWTTLHRRRTHASSYLARLASMNARIDDTLARALKLFGRVIARQHLIELRSAVANLQVPAGRLTGAGYTPADLVSAAQAEATIAELLRVNGERLARSQGQEWLSAMQADLNALAADREAIAAAEVAQAAAVEQLRMAALGIGRQVRAWQQSLADARAAPPALADLPAVLASPAPVVKPPSEAARQSQVEAARAQTRRLRELIGWFTFALLAVSLVISVSHRAEHRASGAEPAARDRTRRRG